MRTALTRWLAAVVFLLAACRVQAAGAEIEGVKLEPTVGAGGSTLTLNGAGVRTRVVFKVYVAALYLPQAAKSTPDILAQKGPKLVQVHMLRNVDGETFANSLADGLKANHTDQQLQAIKAQTDAFDAAIRPLKEVAKGDVVVLSYSPQSGTTVLLNGQPRVKDIAGEEFFSALLRVWLGEKPVDAALKKAMLGSADR